MSRAVVAASMASAGVGILVGVTLAFGEAERRAQKKYDESLKSVTKALERAHTTVNVYAPVETEDELEDLTETEKDRVVERKSNIFEQAAAEGHPAVVVPKEGSGGNDLTRTDDDPEDPDTVPEYVNHYRKALAAKETPVQQFVDGGINDYGVSYIEEDDYDEEDGRFKGQVTLVVTDMEPTFFMDGVQIQDWAERLGDSIFVDFYQLVPPGAPPILYVRNHKRDEDYEVTREIA